MKFKEINKILIKNHPEINEKIVQDKIARKPTMLGLGDVVLKDKERLIPGGGRLDILIQDMNTNRRYEVEIQLGALDSDHLIRCIEYWDTECRRYPQYDHVAVLVVEEVTSRFLNILQIVGKAVRLKVIQMCATDLDGVIGLVFIPIFESVDLGLIDDDEEVQEVADRAYWERLSDKEIVAVVDDFLEITQEFNPSLELNYTKFYIGFTKNDRANNFIIMRPRRNNLFILELRLKETKELTEQLDASNLDLMDYYDHRYRIRLKANEFEKNKEILSKLTRLAYDEMNN